ncbi:MAG: type III PLP-dependent enzyme [Flavobacteriales bacterium]|nr:type III PLP-dependent enzyme [Flavobacteriales bacterium]
MINQTALDTLLEQYDTPLLILSPNKVKKAYLELQDALPNVKLYYAVKSNSHPAIVQTLHEEGGYFDVCSNREVELMKSNNIPSQNCIHTHPIKNPSMIQITMDFGIETFVIENIHELKKFAGKYDQVNLLVRLAIQNENAKANLSKKFGLSDEEEAISLLVQAKKLGVKKIGISFHCGSQAIRPEIFNEALYKCVYVVSKLKVQNINIDYLDIGGGFPALSENDQMSIHDYCSVFTPALEFFRQNDIEIIGEPGRYISANSMLLVSRIIGKSVRNNQPWYYIDDGVYNSFTDKVYGNADYHLYFKSEDRELFPSVIAGPTCDSIDIIKSDVLLPDLEIGSLLIFTQMGAYTSESASCFNGFEKTPIVVSDQIHF